MKLETKFNVGQKVFTIMGKKISEQYVDSIRYDEESGIQYFTRADEKKHSLYDSHTLSKESEVFSSIEELIKDLRNGNN